MQSVPISEELHKTKYDLEDPLHEDEDSPVPGLTHRYPDRVLFLVTNQCSMYCRYCTRSRFQWTNWNGRTEKTIRCMRLIIFSQTPQCT